MQPWYGGRSWLQADVPRAAIVSSIHGVSVASVSIGTAVSGSSTVYGTVYCGLLRVSARRSEFIPLIEIARSVLRAVLRSGAGRLGGDFPGFQMTSPDVSRMARLSQLFLRRVPRV